MLARVLGLRPFKQQNNSLEGKRETHRIDGYWRAGSAKGQGPRESQHWDQTRLPNTWPGTGHPGSH